MLSDPDDLESQRALAAIMPMQKIAIAAVQRTFEG
jgi:hypothetical protein